MIQIAPARRIAPLFSALFALLCAGAAHAQAVPSSGSWTVAISEPSSARVDFGVRVDGPDDDHSSWEHDEPIAQLGGLTLEQIDSSGTPVRFNVVRDAGTLHCTGYVARGGGRGTFTYEPNPHYASDLASRGVSRPTPDDQFRMTMSNVTLSFVDTLRRSGDAVSSPEELIRLANHGVDEQFVTDLAALGYHPSAEGLVRMADHGANPQFVKAMQALGYHADAEDLVRFVDHGVTPNYVRTLQTLGYRNLQGEDLVRMVDHGVTAQFVQGMQSLGYHPTADQLVRLADHGVSVDFVKRLRAHGYNATVDQLIRLRDAGY